jgi:hypothetical protein
MMGEDDVLPKVCVGARGHPNRFLTRNPPAGHHGSPHKVQRLDSDFDDPTRTRHSPQYRKISAFIDPSYHGRSLVAETEFNPLLTRLTTCAQSPKQPNQAERDYTTRRPSSPKFKRAADKMRLLRT